MAHVNIYKVAENKIEDIVQHLNQVYVIKGYREVIHRTINGTTGEVPEISYRFALYYARSDNLKPLKWNWALNQFGLENEFLSGSPRGVILICGEGAMYAVTFGYSYYKIDQFSDKSWAFMYARRLNYSNIKTTALTNPNSQRNKTVNTYLDYEDLDFDSGEALTKLKAKIMLPDNFELFSETIEFGNSIKLSCPEPSLANLVSIIWHINYTNTNMPEIVKIPYFHEVKDNLEKNRLKQLLQNDINTDILVIDFSEYQIYATKIVFNDDHEFEYRMDDFSMHCDRINLDTLLEFINENNLSIEDDLLNIRLVIYEDGQSKYTTDIYKLLFYTNDNEKALLTDGNWYLFNEDYLQYLHDSLAEIPVFYNPPHNYSEALYSTYLQEKFDHEHNLEIYSGLNDDQIMKKIKKKYYRELYYNVLLAEQGYHNFDRDLELIGRHKIEVMDLYKDQTMFSVKFGKSSSKLCYAVDQSLEAIRAYHKNQIHTIQNIKEVCIWLVLERGDLPLRNGNPDINELNMLILKNKLDQWKKSVRVMGYTPIIRINYSR